MRRAAHDGFDVRSIQGYQSAQENRSALLLSGLLEGVDRWDAQLKLSLSATMLSSLYGWSLDDTRADPYVKRLELFVNRMFRTGMPGAFLVDRFPWLLHLPDVLSPWKRDGLEWFKKDTQMFEELLDSAVDTVREFTRHDVNQTQHN